MSGERVFRREERTPSGKGTPDTLLGALSHALEACARDLREAPEAFLERDPAARSRWEVVLLYPGMRALLAHRFAHALWRADLPFAARAVSELSRGLSGIEIHPGADVGRRLVIDHGFGVVIGETAVLEDDVTLYQGVTLGATRMERGTHAKRHPTVRRGASIGVGASVLGDVEIGAEARVGAGAVVLVDVAPGDRVGGIPAVPLRTRPSPSTPPRPLAEPPLEHAPPGPKAKKGSRHAR